MSVAKIINSAGILKECALQEAHGNPSNADNYQSVGYLETISSVNLSTIVTASCIQIGPSHQNAAYPHLSS